MPVWGEIVVGVVLLVAVVGTIVPVLPGAVLALVAIGVWAWLEPGAGPWVVAAVCTAVLVIGQILKVAVPSRTLRASTVPWPVIVAGVAAAVVGFFAVPVIGLPLGFVAGTWLATVLHTKTVTGSWDATVAALKAVGLSTLVEAVSVLWASLIWLTGAVVLAVT